MEQVLVAGANGTTGRKVINLLNASQYFQPVAMVRKHDQSEYFIGRGIPIIIADLEDTITDTVKGMDKVIFAAGSGGKKVKEVDENGAKKMIEDCVKHQIKKFVMLSSMGADNPSKSEDLKAYLEAKHNADEYLKASKLTHTIVRPGSLTDDKATGKIKLAASLNMSGSISRDNVAQTLVRALHDDGPKNITFEIIEGKTLIGKALEGTD